MREYLIYGLVCPKAGCVRYVGKSSSGLKRPNAHRQVCFYKKEFDTHKSRWIRSLLSEGLDYSVVILTRLNSSQELNDAERYWIKYLGDSGCALTNGTLGGDGQSPGYTPSAEALAKVSAKLKGRKQTQEHIDARALAMVGKTIPEGVREKISQTLTGRKLAPFSAEHRSRMSKARNPDARIFTDQYGNHYTSVCEAARVSGAFASNICEALKKNLDPDQKRTIKGYTFRYLEVG